MSERQIGYDVYSKELIGASWLEVSGVGIAWLPQFGEVKALLIIWVDDVPYGSPETLLMDYEQVEAIVEDVTEQCEAARNRMN